MKQFIVLIRSLPSLMKHNNIIAIDMCFLRARARAGLCFAASRLQREEDLEMTGNRWVE